MDVDPDAPGTPAIDIVERALQLWAEPPPEGSAALDRFREVYLDRSASTVRSPTCRCSSTAPACSSTPSTTSATRSTTSSGRRDRRTFAFTITGCDAGTLESPLGAITATGRSVSVTGIDIFTVDEPNGQVTAIWAVADWLGLLLQSVPSATT